MIGHSTPAGRRRNLQAASRGRISFIPAGMQFSYISPSGPFLYYVSLHSVSRQLRIPHVKEGCSTPSRVPSLLQLQATVQIKGLLLSTPSPLKVYICPIVPMYFCLT